MKCSIRSIMAGYPRQARLPCHEGHSALPVTAAELVDATSRIDDLLLAREEGVALGAHLDAQVMTCGRFGLETVAATALHSDGRIIWMNTFAHGY